MKHINASMRYLILATMIMGVALTATAQDASKFPRPNMERLLKALSAKGPSGKLEVGEKIQVPETEPDPLPSVREIYATAYTAAEQAAEGFDPDDWLQGIRNRIAVLKTELDEIQASLSVPSVQKSGSLIEMPDPELDQPVSGEGPKNVQKSGHTIVKAPTRSAKTKLTVENPPNLDEADPMDRIGGSPPADELESLTLRIERLEGMLGFKESELQ